MIKVVVGETTLVADILLGKIIFWKKGKVLKQINSTGTATPLESELECFLKVISGDGADYPDARVGARIVEAVTRGRDRDQCKGRPRVAVIGAGIFGTNCAIELSDRFAVTVFEKNDDILTEASKFNQYRHHWGYHYPRSQETMDDIAATVHDFEERYNPAIIRDFPTYYSIAKVGSKVSAKKYLEFCKKNKLAYEIEYPDKEYLDRRKVTTSLKTFEPIYDFEELKRITADLLRDRNITLHLKHEVIGAHLEKDGKKTLRINTPGGKIIEEQFDFVINVTYARHNHFAKWIGFPVKPIRLDLVEVAWVKLDIPKMSFAVMDGPFTNMVPTGKDDMFTLVHIKHSVRKRFVAKEGLVPKDIFSISGGPITKKIVAESAKWLPIVKKAKIVDVHYVLRGVNAYREHDDARTSDIAEHGFGCYSILGGKIIHAVSVAREMAKRLGEQLK